MGILRYALFAPIGFAFNLLVILTCWLWAFIAAILKLDRLPGPLGWVHTHDDTIYGDAWLKSFGYPHPATFSARFKTAVWWLCRNPGYGFSAYVLGYAGPVTTEVKTPLFGVFDTGAAAGFTVIYVTAKGRRYFSYRRDIPLGAGRFVKLWIGWKQPDAKLNVGMLKVMFNPLRKI